MTSARCRTTATALLVLGAAVTTGCGGTDDGGTTSGQGLGPRGPAMRMTVAACVAADSDVPGSADVQIRQDGDTVAVIGRSVRPPTWIQVTAASGAVQLVADGEVLDEQTGEPGDRVVLAAGDCTPPSPVPT